MKKIFSILITAALILTAAACGGESSPAETKAKTSKASKTTTGAAEAETKAPETEAAETEPAETEPAEAETAPAETESAAETEVSAELAFLRANAPIYAAFIEGMAAYPCRLVMAYDMEGVRVYYEINARSRNEAAAFYLIDDQKAFWTIIKNNTTYLLNEDEKTALYSEGDSGLDGFMSGFSENIRIDVDNARVETGTEEYRGKTYIFEKIINPDYSPTVYADPDTKEVKYFISDYGDVMEILELSHRIDETRLDIPADYAVMKENSAEG